MIWNPCIEFTPMPLIFPTWKPLNITPASVSDEWDTWVQHHTQRQNSMLFYEDGYIIPRRVYDRSFRLTTLAHSLQAIAEINAELREKRKLLAEQARVLLTNKFLEFTLVAKASEVEDSIWAKLPFDIIEKIAMHTFEI
jgi:hypothetical protein